MLGMFHILPFLKGWSYKFHVLEKRDVLRGASPKELRIEEMGWIINLILVSTDAYGTLTLTWQDPELKSTTFDFYAEGMKSVGAFEVDPTGFCQRYYRPNPASTAGIFVSGCFCGGGYGALWPYVPTNIMAISLPKDSTQSSAFVSASAFVIAVTDPTAFIRSYRRFLDPRASLKIDDALLAVGPATFEEA